MLNAKQKRIVFDLIGNTIVSASPGTGKTRTLVARAIDRCKNIPVGKWLALITYTNAGADEISSRIFETDNNIFIGTIHRFCLEYILRPFGWIYGWKKPVIVSREMLKIFIEQNDSIEWGNEPFEHLSRIKRNIDGAISRSIEWDLAVSMEELATRYFQFLESNKLIDFNEVLYRSYILIKNNAFIKKAIAARFYEISVDEFQDTNIFQYEILKAIHECNQSTFFMVGDEKQRIYEFAGAIEDAFARAVPDFSSTYEYLDTTYRSAPDIVHGFSTLFPSHPILKNESEYRSDNSNSIYFYEVAKKESDDFLDSLLSDLIEKSQYKPSEIAILTTSWMEAYTINRHIRSIYATVGLGALPHKSINNGSYLVFRSICRFLRKNTTQNLRSIRNNIDLLLLEVNIEKKAEERILAQNRLISSFLRMDPSITLFDGLVLAQRKFSEFLGTEDYGIKEIIENISPDEMPCWTFLKYIEALSGVGGITVNTIHQSKGLEYEVVILWNISENRLPHQSYIGRSGSNYLYEPLSDRNKENGRTLLYVGMSRAKQLLFITHNWKPSLFLSAIMSRKPLSNG